MKKHVDNSGFPLQIALANSVDKSNHHQWRTRYSEHSWRNPTTGDVGFIDLVLENQYRTQFLIVECKRVKDTSWIFLNDEIEKKPRRHAKSFVLYKTGGKLEQFGWRDITLEPSTPQSKYCVIPGTDNRSQSLIERVAAELVLSTEGLAMEDKNIGWNESEDLRFYFNAIVTTATLQVCRFKPDSISLQDGTLEEADFEEVPFVRFRKQLNPISELPEEYKKFGKDVDVASVKESTVFVINAAHLNDFIKEFDVDDRYGNPRYLR